MAVEKVGQSDKAKKRVTCKNCGTILEYLPCDVKQKTCSHQGDTEVYHAITCPECKKIVEVKQS